MANDAQVWPAELDALHAAPRHHTLLFENASVRVLETRIAAGDKVPLHTHQWPGTLYILSWSEFVRRDAAGEIIFDSRTGKADAIEASPVGTAVWSATLAPHTFENVGSREFHVVSVELKP